MSFDTNRFTQKSQEALLAAQATAERNGNSQVEPEHLLLALLDPIEKMREYEENGQYFERLALMEEAKSKPFGAVWDYYCLQKGAPAGMDWFAEVKQYEQAVLTKRS